MTSKLEQLKAMTTVVADTGDLEAIAQWQPEDATTNPSLLLKAAASEAYRPMLDEAVAAARKHGGSDAEQLTYATDMLAVLAGKQILGRIPGVVSTEVDARLSFDTDATLTRARRLVSIPLAQMNPRQLRNETIRVTLAREETGCLVLPPEPVPLLARMGLTRSARKRLMVAAGAPVLIARGSHPYKKILMAASDEQSANTVTGVAVDIARQCGASLSSLTILPPSLVDGGSRVALRCRPRAAL